MKVRFLSWAQFFFPFFNFEGGFFVSMIYVYVLESLNDATWYTGMAKDVYVRLKEHNAGKNRFTKGHLPWKIIYTEQHTDWASGRVREKYLKSAAGKRWLIKYLNEQGCEGSLPE
ncbi:MAG: GIY-YIG nuclease family protein [Chitinophagaceae bacterium]|nr:GIY-YIG nuclease family protein [Chitinophagaceae bacterium]